MEIEKFENSGRPVLIKMHSNLTLNAILIAVDPDINRFLVKDLAAPLGTIKFAVLRRIDVLRIIDVENSKTIFSYF